MSYTPIDLSLLPAPEAIETLSYESILETMIQDLQRRDSSFTALVESEPAFKILEVAAYREFLLRQRVNDAARGVMLAYAHKGDLDQLGALFGVTRNTISLGDPSTIPPTEPIKESDEEFRRRIQLSLEGFSTAGPVGAYQFHALKVPAVKDVSVESPFPGKVVVTILAREGDGTPDQKTIEEVENILGAETMRPLTDQVFVQRPTILSYQIRATIFTYAGPDPLVVIAAAQDATHCYAAANHKLGNDITLSGIYAALHQPGVQRVELFEPLRTLVVDSNQAAFCAGIEINNGGTAQ